MPKPLIGLTTTRARNTEGEPTSALNLPYSAAVSRAGGLPVLIPLELPADDLEALLDRLDGVLLTGGYDINPRLYGNPSHKKVQLVDDERDRLESQLVRSLVASPRPFFGICRGLQMLNVALGGTLYEHLPEQHPGAIEHDNHGLRRDHLAHPVTIEQGTALSAILPAGSVAVNSLHHQGIQRLAGELKASASAGDGLIEAVELPGHPFALAVQWHPEEMQADPAMRGLFQAFIQACQRNLERKLRHASL